MTTTNRTSSRTSSASNRSRTQGGTRNSSGAGSSRRSGASARTTAGTRRTSNSYSSSGAPYRSYTSRKRKPSPNFGLIAAVGLILILVIAAVAFGMKGGFGGEREESTTAPSEPETELQQEVTVDGISITGMSRDQAREAILKKYPWSMKVTYQDDVYEVANLMAGKVDALLSEIYSGTNPMKDSYSLDTSGLEEAVAAQVVSISEHWDKAAKNGSISGYDSSSDSFTFAGEEVGIAVDQEKLTADIQSAISAKDFDASIQVSVNEVQPEISQANAQNLYKTLGSYTTNTTSNSKRNTNVKLAAQELNGTILQPGEEFSFNNTVGERTEAKGYQSAAAYNNGEVVQEIGGGVCQVSTTLYNAVVKSGLQVSKRQSHTFEPTYVTPGQDATVSWGGPDFRFVNNSKSAIGIKASYYNQTVTASIYGIPVLEEGVTQYLESKKLSDIDPPAPTYEEDQTLQPDEEVVVSSGSKGSRWETRLIVKKNGEIISNDVDHTVTYKGHNPVIKRNTSGVVIGGEETTTAPSESETTMTPAGPGGMSYPQTGGVAGPGMDQPTSPGPSPGKDLNPSISEGPGMDTQPAPADTQSANMPGAAPGGQDAVVPPPVF